jgi:two-component system, OmpR family, phosphate regulon sensor histidine kinase PhoR
MKHSYFKKLFLLYAVILAIALIVSEVFITSAVRESHIEGLTGNLSKQIDIISGRIEFSRNRIDGLCVELKKKTDARVTVVLSDGTVIGDSDSASSGLENHSQRTEIAQALLLGKGSVIRHSDTLQTDFLYVAKKISSKGETTGFIRLAVPLTDIDQAVNRLRINISIILALALFAMWLFSLWQTNHLRKLVGRIRDLSSSLAIGEIDKRMFMKKGGEFGEIAGNLVAMSQKLHGLLEQSEKERNRLNVILKSIPDALLIMDNKGYILLSNAAADVCFCDAPLTGKHYMEALRSNAFSDLVEACRNNPGVNSEKIRLESPSERHFNVLVSPLYYNESELAGFVIVFHDITKIEKLEQVRKDFVANISHEIKTPITAIKGFADTLLDGALADEKNAAKFILTIKQNSERINNLVEDLLTLSRIELGVSSINKADLDIADILDQVVSILGEKAGNKGLSLETIVHEDVCRVVADSDMLIRIFTNLVDNAVKFTEAGRVTFGSGVENSRPVLFVEDTGTGIPPKHLPRLGERFYRVDSARSRKMGGTGLGLAIVKHLVKAHGWEMQIESAPGAGTSVKIYL